MIVGEKKVNYIGMPMGMWALFTGSFRNKLVSVLGYSENEADQITASAKPKYRKIIKKLPAFEKEDRFKMNIVNSGHDDQADETFLQDGWERQIQPE